MNKIKHLATMWLAGVGLLGAAASAHATPLQWSISVGVPFAAYPAPVVVQPAPVYMQPPPVYVQPAPVYVQPAPVYVPRAPVVVRPAPPPVWSGYRSAYYQQPTRWDRDGDGIPNRYERYEGRYRPGR